MNVSRAAGAALCLGVLGSCAAPSFSPIRITGETMGTTFSVTIVSPMDESERRALASVVQATLDAVNASMSTYEADSELSRLNRSDGEWLDVSPELRSVLVAAAEVSELTGGAFDVTVAPLVRLWGFGAGAADVPSPPSPHDLQEVASRVGFQRVTLRDEPPAVRKDGARIELDLSGIAKGYAVDRLAALLTDRGIEDFLVEVGGEVRTSGANPEAQPWRIGIEAPLAKARGLQRTVGLSGLSMATSGDYRNFYEVDGKRLSHLIDPRTAAPIAHPTASVSVVDPSCMRADALASGLLVLGADDGYALAEREGIAALFLVRDGTDVEERMTPAFERLVGNVATMDP